jgi:Fur family peroxide stress response transcriptional regulator
MSTPHQHHSDDFVAEELERFTHACRERGTPVTQQRLAVYRALLTSLEHPDADSIFRALRPTHPTLSLATVYNTVELLEQQGFVREVGAPGLSRRFDANRSPHHHLLCRICGGLTDVELSEPARLELPREIDFRITDFTIQFNGVCRECRTRKDVAECDTSPPKGGTR